MLVTCWSVKGGSGVSVVSAALASLLAQRHGRAAIIDLGGDQPAVLGLSEPPGGGVRDWCDVDAPAERLARLAIEVTPELLLVPRGNGRDTTSRDRAAELAAATQTLAPAVVIDAGIPLRARMAPDADPVAEEPHGSHLRRCGSSLFVTRPCYMALRRAKSLRVAADGIVLLDEPGRSLTARDVSEVLELPVVGVVEADPQVSRAVDSGTLVRNIPRTLSRGLRRAG